MAKVTHSWFQVEAVRRQIRREAESLAKRAEARERTILDDRAERQAIQAVERQQVSDARRDQASLAPAKVAPAGEVIGTALASCVRTRDSFHLIQELKSFQACHTRTYDDFDSELQLLPARLDRLAHGRDRARLNHAALLAAGDELATTAASKLDRCGSLLVFRTWLQGQATRLRAGYFCHQDRLCPVCSILRAGKFVKRYVDRHAAVMAQYPHALDYHVVLTVLDGPDLAERLGHLDNGWRRLLSDVRQRKHGGHRKTFSPLAPALGGVGSIEVKRGAASGQWHPHLHAYVLMPHPIVGHEGKRCRALEDWWHRVTGDSKVVHVERVYGDAISDAFAEVFKYALKFGELTVADNLSAWRTLRGRRLIRPFGAMYGIPDVRDLRDELWDSSDDQWLDLILRHDHQGYALDGIEAGPGVMS
jgi:hypothetical protein